MEEIKVNHIKYSLDPKKANNMKKKKKRKESTSTVNRKWYKHDR